MSSITNRILYVILRAMKMDRRLNRWIEHGGGKRKDDKVPSKRLVKKCRIDTKTIRNRPVYIWNQDEAPPQTTVFYLHGGAFIQGFKEMHFKFLETLIKKTGCRIVAPDYPLLFDASVKDIHAFLMMCYRELVEFDDAHNVVLLGDSAGGNLALALAQRLHEKNHTPPSRLVLISPWLDASLDDARIDEIQPKDPVLDKEALQTIGRMYAGKRGVKNPLVSPLFGSLENIESIAVWTGTHDILYPDALRLQEKAEDTKVRFDMYLYENMMHTWVFFGLKESLKAIQEIAEYINQRRNEEV